MKQNITKIIFKFIRISTVIIPFIWILSKVDLKKLLLTLHDIQWWAIPLYLSIVLISMFLQGLRWWILLHAFNDKLNLLQTVSYHFKSLFYSLVLPTSAAQEIVRTLFVVKKAGASISWSSAWLCKIIGLIISFAFSVYGLILLSDSALSTTLFKAALILFLVICLLVALSFSKRCTTPFRSISRKIIPAHYLSKAENLREGIYQFRYKKKSILFTTVITAITQSILIVGATLLISGITGSFFIKECFAFIPLIEIISMAQPLTPNGMGVREALTAIMFKHLQLSSEQLGIFVLVGNMAILLKLVGAIPILYDMFFKPESKEATPVFNKSDQLKTN